MSSIYVGISVTMSFSQYSVIVKRSDCFKWWWSNHVEFLQLMLQCISWSSITWSVSTSRCSDEIQSEVCHISSHPWISPSLVMKMVSLPESDILAKLYLFLIITATKINTILFIWKKGLAMSVPKNTGLTDPANYCLHFAPWPTSR